MVRPLRNRRLLEVRLAGSRQPLQPHLAAPCVVVLEPRLRYPVKGMVEPLLGTSASNVVSTDPVGILAFQILQQGLLIADHQFVPARRKVAFEKICERVQVIPRHDERGGIQIDHRNETHIRILRHKVCDLAVDDIEMVGEVVAPDRGIGRIRISVGGDGIAQDQLQDVDAAPVHEVYGLDVHEVVLPIRRAVGENALPPLSPWVLQNDVPGEHRAAGNRYGTRRPCLYETSPVVELDPTPSLHRRCGTFLPCITLDAHLAVLLLVSDAVDYTKKCGAVRWLQYLATIFLYYFA